MRNLFTERLLKTVKAHQHEPRNYATVFHVSDACTEWTDGFVVVRIFERAFEPGVYTHLGTASAVAYPEVEKCIKACGETVPVDEKDARTFLDLVKAIKYTRRTGVLLISDDCRVSLAGDSRGHWYDVMRLRTILDVIGYEATLERCADGSLFIRVENVGLGFICSLAFSEGK